MSISFSCECGKRLKVGDNLLGKKVKCPDCQKVTLVTADAAAAPLAKPVAKPVKAKAAAGKRPADETDMADLLGEVDSGLRPPKKKPAKPAAAEDEPDLSSLLGDDDEDAPKPAKKKPVKPTLDEDLEPDLSSLLGDDDEDAPKPAKKKPGKSAAADEDEEPDLSSLLGDDEEDAPKPAKKKPGKPAADEDEEPDLSSLLGDDDEDAPKPAKKKAGKSAADDDDFLSYDDDEEAAAMPGKKSKKPALNEDEGEGEGDEDKAPARGKKKPAPAAKKSSKMLLIIILLVVVLLGGAGAAVYFLFPEWIGMGPPPRVGPNPNLNKIAPAPPMPMPTGADAFVLKEDKVTIKPGEQRMVEAKSGKIESADVLSAVKGLTAKLVDGGKLEIAASGDIKDGTFDLMVKGKDAKDKAATAILKVTVEKQEAPPEKKDPEKKDPEKKDPEKKDPEKKEPEKKEPEKKEPEKKDPQKVDTDANPKDKEIENSIGMKLMRIEPGKFMMGSPPNEKEREPVEDGHLVEITQPFYMGKFEVTQGEYMELMGANPSKFKDDKSDKLPVDSVKWEDAKKFCEKLSAKEGRKYELPTEAEWEYACRAGTKGPFNTGDTLAADKANFNGNLIYGDGKPGEYREKTTDVGTFPANAWGLHDMHGNVAEWCEDRYGKDYFKSSPPKDPKGPDYGDFRCVRGGSWSSSPGNCRSAFRYNEDPRRGDETIGFRVVLRLPKTAVKEEPKKDDDEPKKDKDAPKKDVEPKKDKEDPKKDADEPKKDKDAPKKDVEPKKDKEDPKKDADEPKKDKDAPKKDVEPKKDKEDPKKDADEPKKDKDAPKKDVDEPKKGEETKTVAGAKETRIPKRFAIAVQIATEYANFNTQQQNPYFYADCRRSNVKRL